jgi:glucosamine--fructose-6-phosphate aminotransferase (isomerizing)
VTGRSSVAGGDPFLDEIGRQPEAIRQAARAMAGQADRLQALAERRPTGPLVMTGMGSSYDACHVAVTMLAEGGLLTSLINAAELLHFQAAALDARTTLVIVSQSGQSVEIVRLLERLAERPDRPFVVAVTNGRDNPLATFADVALDTDVGPEMGPSTMTFAASMVALDAVARVLGADETADIAGIVGRVAADAEGAAAAAERLLADRPTVTATMTAWLDDRPHMVILGRGVSWAAAEMAALTVKEVAGAFAEALVAADFRHGPLELIDADLAVAFVTLESATDTIDRSFAAELAAGPTHVVVVGHDPEPSGVYGSTAASIAIGPVDRRLAPAVAMIPFQLLARELAIARGRRPGEFNVASKVTTRE